MTAAGGEKNRSAIVHALMQKAQDLDAARVDSVNQGMARVSDRIFASAGAAPWGTDPWI